jgi:hypothetical protein
LKGLFSNIESLYSQTNERVKKSLLATYKRSFQNQAYFYVAKLEPKEQEVLRAFMEKILTQPCKQFTSTFQKNTSAQLHKHLSKYL